MNTKPTPGNDDEEEITFFDSEDENAESDNKQQYRQSDEDYYNENEACKQDKDKPRLPRRIWQNDYRIERLKKAKDAAFQINESFMQIINTNQETQYKLKDNKKIWNFESNIHHWSLISMGQSKKGLGLPELNQPMGHVNSQDQMACFQEVQELILMNLG